MNIFVTVFILQLQFLSRLPPIITIVSFYDAERTEVFFYFQYNNNKCI